MRKQFVMSADDRATILEACRPVPYMLMLGAAPVSQQERANTAWKALGARMGFDGMTVQPVPSQPDTVFTAEEAPVCVVAALPVQLVGEEPTETDDSVEQFALESSVGHLCTLVDELRRVQREAMRIMRDLHAAAVPDETTADLDACIPAAAFAAFVDAHARLLYEIKNGCAADPVPVDGWMPIATAPEGEVVVVFYLEAEDTTYPERHEFDYLEDGVWQKHAEDREHFLMVAPPGSTGPKETAPYTHWKPLGAPAGIRPTEAA